MCTDSSMTGKKRKKLGDALIKGKVVILRHLTRTKRNTGQNIDPEKYFSNGNFYPAELKWLPCPYQRTTYYRTKSWSTLYYFSRNSLQTQPRTLLTIQNTCKRGHSYWPCKRRLSSIFERKLYFTRNFKTASCSSFHSGTF